MTPQERYDAEASDDRRDQRDAADRVAAFLQARDGSIIQTNSDGVELTRDDLRALVDAARRG